MIPKDHPRYTSLVTRKHLADCARKGIFRGKDLPPTGAARRSITCSAKKQAKAPAGLNTWPALLRTASRPVISVNGNTAALAAREIALLQKACGAKVEVNLFHRTRNACSRSKPLLRDAGADVFSGQAERLLPLSHDRAFSRRDGMYAADVVLVPLEDGDRCEVLVDMGKKGDRDRSQFSLPHRKEGDPDHRGRSDPGPPGDHRCLHVAYR